MTRNELKALIKECISEDNMLTLALEGVEEVEESTPFMGAIPELNHILEENRNFTAMLGTPGILYEASGVVEKIKEGIKKLLEIIKNAIAKIGQIMSNFVEKIKNGSATIKSKIINIDLKEPRVAKKDLTVKFRDYTLITNYMKDLDPIGYDAFESPEKAQETMDKASSVTDAESANSVLEGIKTDINNSIAEVGKKYNIENGLNSSAVIKQVKESDKFESINIKKGEQINSYVEKIKKLSDIADAKFNELEKKASDTRKALQDLEKLLKKAESEANKADDKNVANIMSLTVKFTNWSIDLCNRYFKAQISCANYLYSSLVNHATFIVINSSKAKGGEDTTKPEELKALAVSANQGEEQPQQNQEQQA